MVDGVPGTGAPVVTRYFDPAGQLLQVSVIDATSVFAFIRASDLGVDIRDAESLNANHEVLELLEYIRSHLAVQLGRVEDPALAATESATVPRIMLFEPGTGDTDGVVIRSLGVTRTARRLMDGRVYVPSKALPVL